VLGKVFRSPEWWCARYNFVGLALGIGLILGLFRTRKNEAILRKFFLILILGSNFPYHQVHYIRTSRAAESIDHFVSSCQSVRVHFFWDARLRPQVRPAQSQI